MNLSFCAHCLCLIGVLLLNTHTLTGRGASLWPAVTIGLHNLIINHFNVRTPTTTASDGQTTKQEKNT